LGSFESQPVPQSNAIKAQQILNMYDVGGRTIRKGYPLSLCEPQNYSHNPGCRQVQIRRGENKHISIRKFSIFFS
jgi:hypothetical protein